MKRINIYNTGADNEIRIFDHKGEANYIAELTFSKRVTGTYCEPSMVVSDKELQSMFDTLWAAGLRPAEYANVFNQLTEENKTLKKQQIDDARKMAEGLPDISKSLVDRIN